MLKFKHEINVFFEPRSIAVVGASPKPGSIGRAIVENLMRSFKGKLYPVNPKYDEILGLKAYPSISKIPDEVDIAVIAVRAQIVPMIAEDAGKKGVRGLIVVSGGFAEAGAEGKRLQEELLSIAKAHRMRVIGPNCIGVYNAVTGVDTFFLPWERMRRPHKGPIAIISQSGAFLASVMDWAAEEGIGISKAVNFGNKVDVDEVDLISYFGDDDDIKVIIAYLEDIKPGRGRRFIEVAREVIREKGKSIVLLKAGRTSAGARAASSHTAALAGSYEVFRAAMKQAGVLEVDDPIRLFDAAKALASLNPPRGKRVGIVTNAGGPGVIATDTLVRLGLEVPQFTEKLQEKLRRVFPARVSTGNPVDLTGDATPEDFEKALKLVIDSDEVDMVMVLSLMQPPTMDLSVADRIADIAWRRKDKPVAVVTIGSEYAKSLREYLENRGIPVYDFPDRAAFALYALSMASIHEWAETECPDIEVEVPRDNVREASKIIESALAEGRSKLLEHEALRLLRLYGLPVPEYCVARTREEAERCGRILEKPLAAKIISPDIIHKSDVGGVILDIGNAEEAVRAYTKILSNVRGKAPNARIYGVLYQNMVPYGLEVIVGAKRDPVFGPVILFGLGGVFVEALKDVSLRVAPLSACEAYSMLGEIRASALLEGYRDKAPRDKRALASIILKIAQLMLDQPAVRELDLNPVMAYRRGAAVADARVILG